MLKKNRSVKTVCFQLGFKRVSHFSREFKSHYGIPPTEFLRWSDLHGGPPLRAGESPRQITDVRTG
jgi:AraC-like DNA-binding protein